jgi:anti-sigma regulatory factor (Ser/Thr protein kinase)
MITTDNNRVVIKGAFRESEFRSALAAIHSRITRCGYQDIILDFSLCTAAFAGPMLAVCAQVCSMKQQGIDFKLVLPQKEILARLFMNTNWAHIIDPVQYELSKFRGLRQVPTAQFHSSDEQNAAVNRILNIILGSLSDFTRGDLAAIEWSLNEISDNVINHADSPVGGFLHLSTFRRDTKRLEYVVCDAGVGIPETLRQGKPEITTDSDALDHAIREGITKDIAKNQGNGLFGAFQISRVSKGYLEIHSGYGSLIYNDKHGLHIRREQIPYKGTLVVACTDYSDPGLLAEALKFGGKPHYPVDFIETRFEDADGNRVSFMMKEEASSFGSRKAAEPINTKLKNLANLCGECKVFIDFAGVPVISSSFADEVFGKLFLEFGPLAFIQKFEFMNTTDTVRSLIDRAINLRSASG